MTTKKMDVRVHAIIASIILSLIVLTTHHDPVNYDGIFYLSVVGVYLKSGFAAAATIYHWPFYILLIGWTSQLTHLSILYSAYLINTLLIALIVTVFISLLKELGASRGIQIVGAIIILVYPPLNNYRDYVMRDFGYWAFSLIALWQLLRYAKTNHWTYAMTWNLSMLIATLFRLEGGVVLLLTPLTLLLLRNTSCSDRFKKLAVIYLIPVTLAILLFLWHIYFSPQGHLGRLSELLNQFKNGWFLSIHNFQQKITLINHTILPSPSSYDASFFFWGGALTLFVSILIASLTWLYTLLFGHAWTKKLLTTEINNKIILYGFIIINLLIPFIFFSQQLFLSERYLIAFCLPLLLWIPYSLQTILQQRKKLFVIIAILLLVMFATSIVRFGPSKAYITEAGLWLKNNTSTTATVYSNNMQVLFYAERTPIDLSSTDLSQYYDDNKPLQTLQTKSWQNFNYLALRVNREWQNQESEMIALVGKQPVKIFHNKRGDEILIFELKP